MIILKKQYIARISSGLCTPCFSRNEAVDAKHLILIESLRYDHENIPVNVCDACNDITALEVGECVKAMLHRIPEKMVAEGKVF